jgi:ribonuclease HI
LRKYIVYTDGASRCFEKNTKRVGVTYAVIMQQLTDGSTVIVNEVSGVVSEGTNNRSEMLGPLIAIDAIVENDRGPKSILIYTDSDYVVKNFKIVFKKYFTEDRKMVYTDYPNWDLWNHFGRRKMEHDIKIKWIRGHNGDQYNEYCDKMCDAIYRGEIKPTYELK